MKVLSVFKKSIALLIVALVILLSSCSFEISEDAIDMLERIAMELEEKARAPYTVSFEFDDINDEQIIKQRLIAINCTVEKSTQEGEYVVTSPNVLNEDWFSIICSNNETVLVNESGQIFLDKEDVLNCKSYNRNSIDFEVTAEFFNKHYETYFPGNYYLEGESHKSPVHVGMEFKDGKYTMLVLAENSTSGIDLSDDNKAIISATVYYSSAQLNSTVTSNIIKKPY